MNRRTDTSNDDRQALAADRHRLPELLDLAVEEAKQFLDGLDEQPVGRRPGDIARLMLPLRGAGLEDALKIFRERYGQWLSGSPGPRYFAFVTGGATPAALVGDWLTSAFDQNASDAGESCVRQLSLDAVHMFRELMSLPKDFDGVFVTGATMSNFVGLALARQWLGRHGGVDVAADGVGALGDVAVFSGTAHSSIYKSLAMLGLGRRNLRTVATLPGREAVDVDALDAALNWYRAAPGSGLRAADTPPVTVPTCYIWGTEDASVGRAAAEGTAGHVTGPYRLVEIEGGGHFLTGDGSNAMVTDALLDHLVDNGPAGTPSR